MQKHNLSIMTEEEASKKIQHLEKINSYVYTEVLKKKFKKCLLIFRVIFKKCLKLKKN